MTYPEFIQSKIPAAPSFGFEPPSECHESLKPHQRDITPWMVRGGRRACFASFGLGKTRMHLQTARWVIERHPDKRFLIVAPLGVRAEFTQSEGPAMGMDVRYCRTDEEVAACPSPFVITNYERVRDGQVTVRPDVFAGAGLDEASVLRSFGSKTYQTFLDLFRAIPYRFVFTATPSPNRHKELIHYAGFLGVMDTGDCLTRFFKRDPKKAGNLTLLPSMEEQFWLWVATWAVFIQRPSDLGHSDEGYDLPPLKVHWHRLEADHKAAWAQYDGWGQAQLLADRSTGLAELAEVKRETIAQRLAFANGLMFGDHRWTFTPSIDPVEMVIDAALHHVAEQYVVRKLKEGATWGEAFGIGGGMIGTQMWEADAKGIRVNGEDKPSIKPKRIMQRLDQYKERPQKHWLLWHDLEAERHMIERAVPGVRTAYGSQDLEEREDIIQGFARGEFQILATKPIIAGSGTNLQRHCADAIYLGSTFKFNDFIQSLHRIERFGQTREVNIHVIYSESEDGVIAELKRKWREHDELVARMTALLRKFKLSLKPDMELKRKAGVERAEVAGEKFRAILNDAVLETADWPDNCVDEIVTSIPFGNQYEYSPSVLDFGHNEDNEAFFAQMDYLIPNLLRIIKPGRVACIHVKDRIRFGKVTGLGMPTVDPFSDDTVRAFKKHGWAYMGRITIDTDVVRENNQTYRLGWSENAKDSTKMGVGLPEYVLLFRKLPSDLSDAYADTPVTKDKSAYGLSDWQLDASSLWRSSGNRLIDPERLAAIPREEAGRFWKSYCAANGYDYKQHVEAAKALEAKGRLPKTFMLFPPISRHPDVWTDICRMRVLNSQQASRGKENHVCPLQTDIVERLVRRFSNPGEIVFDPFGGIGTVPYMAIKMGRVGWSTELSDEYWRCAVGYCEQAEAERTMPTLFDLMADKEQALTGA